MILLVDGRNLAYRMGISNPLYNKRKEPVGAIYLFLKVLSKYVEKLKPDSVVVCWDSPGSYWRRSIYPEYKTNRKDKIDKEITDEIHQQIDKLEEEVLPLLPVAQVVLEGWEADDVIAALWLYTRSVLSQEICILSTDKDFYQLIDGKTSIVNSLDDPPLDFKWFVSRYSFTPDQWPLFRALTGDPSDGIKGVQYVGEARAEEIVATRGDGDCLSGVRKYIQTNSGKRATVAALTEALETGYLWEALTIIDLRLSGGELLQRGIGDHDLLHALLVARRDSRPFDYNGLKMYLAKDHMPSLIANFDRWTAPFGGLIR